MHLAPCRRRYPYLPHCERIKIGIVPSNHKIKLPFDMGFNKIEKLFKYFNVFDCPQQLYFFDRWHDISYISIADCQHESDI